MAIKDQLFVVPVGTPDWRKVHVVRAGVHVGTFKKNRFEPSHSLATALNPADFQLSIETTQEEYTQYRMVTCCIVIYPASITSCSR